MVKYDEPEYTKVHINEKNIQDGPSKYGYGVRHVQLAIFLLCLTTIIIGRGHLGVTIIAMTSDTGDNIAILGTMHVKRNNDIKIVNDTTNNNVTMNLKPDYIRIETEISVNNTQKYKTFRWSKSIQEMVLYAFALGYLILMFPMGVVCQRYGDKLPLQISLLITGIVSIITPWLTEWGGWKAISCCRIVQGLCQAGTYPSIQGLLGKWAAAEESATLSSYVHTGLQIGSVISFQLAGFLGASDWGWPSIFYAVGTLSILCYLVLTIWGSANPIEHKSITDEERNYILGVAVGGESKQKLETPWREIFRSTPLWGTIIAELGTVFIFVLFYNQVPTYLHHHLHINIRNNGLLTSLPYVASFFSTILFGLLSDYCTNKNIISKINARRIFNSVGTFGMAFCLILTSYTNNVAIVITCLIMAMAVNMGTNVGWLINFIDLAPNFSGTLTSMGGTLSGTFVLTLPVIVSYVVTDMTNIIQWRILYFIVAAMSIVANIIFIVLVSTDIQPWNDGCQKESSAEEEESRITIDLTTKQN